MPLSHAPAPYGAIPTPAQLAWHEREFYGFLHFSPNTFTDREWGYGDEDPAIFHPTAFDPDQIVRALKSAGMRGVLLTAKHHDGFCLWPTKTTKHSVAASGWKGGKGDVVREIADACRRHGLAFGVYLSPWDRNHPAYGTAAYVEVYRQQLTELLTGYGPLFEVWHDGANGGDGYYGGAREIRRIDKTAYYDWPTTWALVQRLQPGAVIFSDAGPGCRWVGNERGVAGDPCWATIDGTDLYPGKEGIEAQLNRGDRGGSRWIPAECDVSLRPGWFFHAAENAKVKTAAQLAELYFQSVGRGANFLLNVPPDRRGRLHENDVAVLRAFGEWKRATFSKDLAAGARAEASEVRGGEARYGPRNLLDGDRQTYWASEDAGTTPEARIDWERPKTFDIVRLRECLPLGQRIESFALDAWQEGAWTQIGQASGIGACRLVRLESPVTTRRLRLRVTASPVGIALSELAVFRSADLPAAR